MGPFKEQNRGMASCLHAQCGLVHVCAHLLSVESLVLFIAARSGLSPKDGGLLLPIVALGRWGYRRRGKEAVRVEVWGDPRLCKS